MKIHTLLLSLTSLTFILSSSHKLRGARQRHLDDENNQGTGLVLALPPCIGLSGGKVPSNAFGTNCDTPGGGEGDNEDRESFESNVGDNEEREDVEPSVGDSDSEDEESNFFPPISNPSPPLISAPQTQTQPQPQNVPPPISGNTINALAATTRELQSLFRLITSAGLNSALIGPGPLTVFAPVNSALPDNLGLLQLQSNPNIVSMLTYHVVPGLYPSSELRDGQVLSSLNGANITIGVNETVTVNSAKVLRANIQASNGIIHMIDSLLMPPLESESMTASRVSAEP